MANLSHVPTVWIHGNHIHDYLHIRLSAFADNPVFLGPGVEITRGEKR